MIYQFQCRVTTNQDDPKMVLIWLLQEISMDLEAGKNQGKLEHENYSCQWRLWDDT